MTPFRQDMPPTKPAIKEIGFKVDRVEAYVSKLMSQLEDRTAKFLGGFLDLLHPPTTATRGIALTATCLKVRTAIIRRRAAGFTLLSPASDATGEQHRPRFSCAK